MLMLMLLSGTRAGARLGAGPRGSAPAVGDAVGRGDVPLVGSGEDVADVGLVVGFSVGLGVVVVVAVGRGVGATASRHSCAAASHAQARSALAHRFLLVSMEHGASEPAVGPTVGGSVKIAGPGVGATTRHSWASVSHSQRAALEHFFLFVSAAHCGPERAVGPTVGGSVVLVAGPRVRPIATHSPVSVS